MEKVGYDLSKGTDPGTPTRPKPPNQTLDTPVVPDFSSADSLPPEIKKKFMENKAIYLRLKAEGKIPLSSDGSVYVGVNVIDGVPEIFQGDSMADVLVKSGSGAYCTNGYPALIPTIF